MHSTFELIYSQQDDLIHAGKLCVEENKAYETCIEGAFSDQLVSAYGCLPPWWPKENNITCEKDLPVKQVSDKVLEKISADLDNLSDGLKIGVMKKCPTPCVTTKVKVSMLTTFPHYPYHAKMKLTIPGTITMTKAIYLYTPFNLVVEFGSALGLWLGLSAITLVDLTLLPFRNFRHFTK